MVPVSFFVRWEGVVALVVESGTLIEIFLKPLLSDGVTMELPLRSIHHGPHE